MQDDTSASPTAGSRRAIVALIIVLACSTQVARIARVESTSGRTPLLSANDRSRWAAIRAVVDQGTFALDDVVLRPTPPKPPSADIQPAPWPYRYGPPSNRDRDWYSIDMVRHRGPDGREHYYSSKPPLLNLILAIPYWAFSRLTGATLADQPFYVVRILLVVVNVLPFALLLVGVARMAQRYARTEWGQTFVVAAAGFGTLLTPFASTLNNHSLAAFATFAALACTDQIVRRGDSARGWWFGSAGMAAALAAVAELPALALVAAVLVALARVQLRRTLVWAVPPVVGVACLAFAANYLAHQSWRPPYAHRQDGKLLASLPAAAPDPAVDAQLHDRLRQEFAGRGFDTGDDWQWIPTADAARFVLWQPHGQWRWAVVRVDDQWEVRTWDNWYEYDGSYWTDEGKVGVDRGEPSRWVYALHVTVGHHGLFSLSPIWLMTIVGLGVWVVRGDAWQRRLACGIAAISLVVLAFYLERGLADRNYGGVSCGFRWMLWLATLWLAGLIPAADLAARSAWSRGIAWCLLGASAFSAAYSAQNPWSHPWLFEYWTQLGWIQY